MKNKLITILICIILIPITHFGTKWAIAKTKSDRQADKNLIARRRSKRIKPLILPACSYTTAEVISAEIDPFQTNLRMTVNLKCSSGSSNSCNQACLNVVISEYSGNCVDYFDIYYETFICLPSLLCGETDNLLMGIDMSNANLSPNTIYMATGYVYSSCNVNGGCSGSQYSGYSYKLFFTYNNDGTLTDASNPCPGGDGT